MLQNSFKTKTVLFFLLLSVAVLSSKNSDARINDGLRLKIASWNLFDFGGKFGGVAKANDDTILRSMRDVMMDYDVILVQEIAHYGGHAMYSTASICSGIEEDILEGNTADTAILASQSAAYPVFQSALTNFISAYNANSQPFINSITCDPFPTPTSPGPINLVGNILQAFNAITDFSPSVTPPTRYSGQIQTPFIAFNNLCNQYLNSPNKLFICKATAQSVGSAEGYGVILKRRKGLKVEVLWTGSTTDFVNPSISQGTSGNSMARPPAQMTFKQNAIENPRQMVIYDSHTSPSAGVKREIRVLSSKLTPVVSLNSNNVISLGDLNADGNGSGVKKGGRCVGPYYPGGFAGNSGDFAAGWNQVIKDDETTNFAATTQCAYDRITISNSINWSLNNSVSGKSFGIQGDIGGKTFNNIFVGGGTSGKALSDHRLVWAEFSFGGISSTDAHGNEQFSFSPTDNVFFRGIQFVNNMSATPASGSSYSVYVTSAIPEGGSLGSSVATVYANYSGDLYNLPTRQAFNLKNYPVGTHYIVVDVNGDGLYQGAIDAATSFVVNDPEPPVAGISTVKVADPSLSDAEGDSTSLVSGQVLKKYNTGTGTIVVTKATDDHAKTAMLSDVQIQGSGAYSGTIDVTNPTLSPGLYNVGLDYLNNSGGVAGSVIDHVNQAGLIVTNSSAGYNDVVTINDRGTQSGIFETDKTQNIYLLAKNLSVSKNVDIYIVSNEIAGPNGVTQGMNLQQVSVPNIKNNNLQCSNVYCQTVNTSPRGTIFTSIWQGIYYQATQDFVNAYGKEFNIVIDQNQNGIFDLGDKINVYQVDQIASWFASNSTLNNKSSGVAATSAITQYQELLNAKLNLREELKADGKFGNGTQEASGEYVDSAFLNSDKLDVIKQDAMSGFEIVIPNDVVSNQTLDSGIYNYNKATIQNTTLGNAASNSEYCSVIYVRGGLTLNNVKNSTNCKTAMVAETTTIANSFNVGGRIAARSLRFVVSKGNPFAVLVSAVASNFYIGSTVDLNNPQKQ